MPSGDTFGVLYRNNINYSHDTAASISYDNTIAGDLTSTDVQAAIDEINNRQYELGEEYVAVDRTTASSGILPETVIQLDATGKAIIERSLFVTAACFTPGAQYTTASAVWLVIDRYSGHYLAAVGNNTSNLRKGTIRLTRPEDRYDQVIFQIFGFPSGTTVYLQKLIFIPQ